MSIAELLHTLAWVAIGGTIVWCLVSGIIVLVRWPGGLSTHSAFTNHALAYWVTVWRGCHGFAVYATLANITFADTCATISVAPSASVAYRALMGILWKAYVAHDGDKHKHRESE